MTQCRALENACNLRVFCRGSAGCAGTGAVSLFPLCETSRRPCNSTVHRATRRRDDISDRYQRRPRARWLWLRRRVNIRELRC